MSRIKLAAALVSAATVAWFGSSSPSRATDNDETVSIDEIDCTFGKMKSMRASLMLSARERPAYLLVTDEFSRRYPTAIKVCNSEAYFSLPPGARQVFGRQLLYSDQCNLKVADAARRHDFASALSYAQQMTRLATSLAAILGYGDIRADAADSAKQGAKRIADTISTAVGFKGKFGKVFEAFEGALSARALVMDVGTDEVTEKIKEPLFDKMSDQIAELVGKQEIRYSPRRWLTSST